MRSAFVIFIISLIFYSSGVILIGDLPFCYDEGSYALMVDEFTDDPSIVMPTITGEHAEWKPPLFTWVYSVFYMVLKNLNLPVESALRLPSAFFGAASVSLVFLIARKLYDERVAFAATGLFLTSLLPLLSSSLIMMEAFSLFLILASIYLYLTEKPIYGMVFIGMLTMTKWLYVAVPVLFITLHFIKSRSLRHILLSFFAVPLSLAIYLLLAYFFGNFGYAISNLTFDFSRSLPIKAPLDTLVSFVSMIVLTFPLSMLFMFLAFFGKVDFWKERHLLAVGMIAFILPILTYFLFWYAIVSVPAMAIFLAKRLEELDRGKLFIGILCGLMLVNVFIFLALPLFKSKYADTKEAAQFMKGKNVTFMETQEFYGNWRPINERYIDTEKSYLLLEQLHPGILFYMFSDSSDYSNLRVIFTNHDDTEPACIGYLVAHGNASVPDCFEFLWQKPSRIAYYRAYKAR